MTRPVSLRTFKLPLSMAVSSCLLMACSTAPTAPPVAQTPIAIQPTPVAVQPIVEPAPWAGEVANIWDTPAAESSVLDAETLAILDDLLEARDMSMVEGDRLSVTRYGDLWDRIRVGYRMSIQVSNPRIEAQKNWFSSRQTYLDRLTARASRYLHHTVTEAERRGIPTELALLPIIESSYDPSATSNASAAGLWQFIPSTGRIYGLNQSSTYDGRRDVIESTRAAYDFLTSLYNQFGSWELALAAYNAGPGRIQRAIDANAAQGLPTDFWSLRLPTETMNYVPRFLAVAQIVANPAQHGVSLPAIANHAHFRTVPVPAGISLYDVSIITNVPVSELQLLNPALLNLQVEGFGANRVVIPNSVDMTADSHLSSFGGTMVKAPDQKTQYVVPQSVAVVNQDSVQELKVSNTLPTTTAQVTSNQTIIQEPPLSKEERDFIAQQIRQTSQVAVSPINPQDGNIELNAVQTAQSVLENRGEKRALRYDRLSNATPSSTHASNSVAPTQPIHMPMTSAQTAQARSSTYVVQKGDTLSGIAARYGVTVADLRAWNQMSPNSVLQANARLKVVGTPVSNPSNTQSSPKVKADSHKVVSGDTLIGVAAQYGLTTAQLASYNNLQTDARIIAGNKLWLVPGKVASNANKSSKAQATTYKVKSGDTLIGLANQFDTTTAEIAALNSFGPNDGLIAGRTINLPSSADVDVVNTKSAQSRQARPKTYKVKSGDTLIGLANQFDTTTAEIAALNSFGPNDGLIAGRTINLPSETSDKTAQNQTTSGQAIKDTESYKIQSGDTLTALSAKYSVSIADLAKTNDLSSNAKLVAGQTIKVPKLTTTHTVRSGESLNSLARRYKTTVAELANMNGLKPTDGLKINQKLTVPNN